VRPDQYQTFVVEFRRVSAALESYKRSPDELTAKADAYFHVLKRFDLPEVIAKADAWLQTETKMPKPAEWAGIVPRRPQVELSVMTDAESRDYRRAETLGFEDIPCACALCVQADVTEKPIRFVPDLDYQDRDRLVKDPLMNRVVCAGHWAHGAELARWYRARADFYNRCVELGLRGDVLKPKEKPRATFKQRMDAIFGTHV
jgi:hypothetical protein